MSSIQEPEDLWLVVEGRRIHVSDLAPSEQAELRIKTQRTRALADVLALPELQDEHDASNQYERVDEVARNTLRASIRAAIERMK